MTNGSRNERWFDGEDHRPVGRDVLAAEPPHAEVDVERPAAGRRARSSRRPGSTPRCGRVVAGVEDGGIHGASAGGLTLRTPRRVGQLQCLDGTRPLTRTLRGALAGAVAAGGVVGPAAARPARVRRRPTTTPSCSGSSSRAARPPAARSASIHVANGALFGALYANVAPRLPVPAWARGPLAGLAEHCATLAGDPPAAARPPRRRRPAAPVGQRPRVRPGHLAPRAVRHRARRARAPAEPARRAAAARSTSVVVSTNGHGAVEHLVGTPGP